MAIQTLFNQNVKPNIVQVIFVHPCPEEGSENMQFIVNVASPPSASSQGFKLTGNLSLCIFNHSRFYNAFCGASSTVSFVPVSLLVYCELSGVANHARCYFFFNFGFS